ncbi:MAG: ribosome small subunit-dependent GTPase A [Eubacteriales bacterium]|nr:ribosome small subunit-dependent GTPase A [Eubacteriales bacterium]
MNKYEGKVIKGLGGLFEVRYHTEEGYKTTCCRARGNIKKNDSKVLVGDNVYITEDGSNTVIESIAKRKNALIRPPVANLDYMFITFAAAEPTPMLSTIDKMTAIAEYNKIKPIIIVTKSDRSDLAVKYADIYRQAGFETFICSSIYDYGIEEIKKYVTDNLSEGKIGAFSGASGVGKSTLMNEIFPTLEIETGSISKKIQRGRHTTRHVELFPIDGNDDCGYLADTPGFSLIDFERFDFFGLDDLFGTFPEFLPYSGKCRYTDCSHTGESEDECALAAAALDGKISKSRLDSYRNIYVTLKNKKNY